MTQPDGLLGFLFWILHNILPNFYILSMWALSYLVLHWSELLVNHILSSNPVSITSAHLEWRQRFKLNHNQKVPERVLGMFVPCSQCDDIWRWELGALNEVLMMGLALIWRHTREISLSPHPCAKKSCEHRARWQPLTSREQRPQNAAYLAGTSVLDFPAFRLCEINACCGSLNSLIQQAIKTRKDCYFILLVMVYKVNGDDMPSRMWKFYWLLQTIIQHHGNVKFQFRICPFSRNGIDYTPY